MALPVDMEPLATKYCLNGAQTLHLPFAYTRNPIGPHQLVGGSTHPEYSLFNFYCPREKLCWVKLPSFYLG